jgi:hypothetical protein
MSNIIVPLGITPILGFEDFTTSIASDISLTDVCSFLDFSDLPLEIKYEDLSNLIYFDGTSAKLEISNPLVATTSVNDVIDNRLGNRIRILARESARATIGKALYDDFNDTLDIFDKDNDLSGNLFPDSSGVLSAVFEQLTSNTYDALLLAANQILDLCDSRQTSVSGILRPNDILLFNTYVYNGVITVVADSVTGGGNSNDVSFFVAQDLTFDTGFTGGRVNIALSDEWVDGDANASYLLTGNYNVYTLDRSSGPYIYPGTDGNPEYILKGDGDTAQSAGGVLVRMALKVVNSFSS